MSGIYKKTKLDKYFFTGPQKTITNFARLVVACHSPTIFVKILVRKTHSTCSKHAFDKR